MGSGTASSNWERVMLGFWVHRLNSGQVPEPEWVYVPVEEKYDLNAPENILREMFGRYRCPACGKAFFFQESAWDCHPEASAYKVWKKYAHCGPAGARSLGDAIRAEISNPYGALSNYSSGGPFGI